METKSSKNMETKNKVIDRAKMVEHIASKERELASIAAKLKQDFVGLDSIIDQLITNIKVWYIFPELQIRPTIVCLWGLTGVGKTDMVRKMVSYMKMQDRFLEIEMQGDNDSSKKIQNRLDSSSIAPEESCILFLDEFQKFRTVAEDGTVNNNNSAYQDVWTLLSDGKFQADLTRKTELLEQLLYSKYYKDWEDTEKANSKNKTNTDSPAAANTAAAAAEGTVPPVAEDKKITVKRKYQTPVYLARRVKRLFKVQDSMEEIMKWDDDKIMSLYEQCANNPALYEGDSFKKMLIIVSGNLDEAYRIANDVGEADADADYYHERSKKLTVIDIKYALRHRFRPEQIARFGNSHILYPSLSRANYMDIIIRKCQQISDLIASTNGITVTYDHSVYKVMYDNGVFPTQGVRPLLSTITNILSSALPTFIYKCLLADTDTCHAVVDVNKMSAKIGDEKVEILIPTVLDQIRNEITDDYKHLVAVHELGHAVVYCLLYGTPPKQICANSTSSYTGGFVIPHSLLMHKDGENKYLRVCMAGVAAETIVFGSNMISNGAEQDIHHATNRAWAMLAWWGWEKYSSALTQEFKDGRNIVPEDFNNECERMIVEAKKGSMDLLHKYMSLYKQLLPALLTKEKMTAEDFIEAFAAHNITLVKVDEEQHLAVGYDEMTKKFLENPSSPSSRLVEGLKIDGTYREPVNVRVMPKQRRRLSHPHTKFTATT